MGSLSKIVVALGAIVASAYLIQPYRPVIVKGPSMTPTFEDGELVFSVPLTRTPRRGDIVLVEHDGATIIKRVTMVPGDQYLEVMPKLAHTWSIATTSAVKKLAEKHIVASRMSTVPKGMIYIVGDNSLNSLDSRSFGFVPVSSVRGLVQPIA